MCGIAGAIALASNPPRLQEPLQAVVQRMNDNIAHRGPDGEGIWSSPRSNAVLAQRRLAIVELSELGRQPMEYGGGRYWVTFNGEIYNFRELAAELRQLGHAFRGHSDTEVILAAAAQWGVEQALQRFVGMFAFALWDEHEQVLHLARDRIGEKPLFVGQVGDHLYFCSEVRAFRVIPGFSGRINPEALAAYLRDGYVPTALSIHQGVFQLPPGHVLSVPANRGQRMPSSFAAWNEGAAAGGELRPRRYWDCSAVASSAQTSLIVDEQAAADELERLLRSSVRLQMQADVPIGAFLSGGVDSTVVTALLQQESPTPVHTFTVAFDNPDFDESHYARAIAAKLGTRHEEFVLNTAEIVRRVPALTGSLDEPVANASFFPVLMIAELARTRVKVVLSGDGGDELFAGYNRYALLRRLQRTLGWIPGPLRSTMAAALRLGSPQSLDRLSSVIGRTRMGSQVKASAALAKLAAVLDSRDLAQSYSRLTSCWDPLTFDTRPSLPERHWNTRMHGDLAKMLLADQLDYLPGDNLAKVDRASMAVALETRLPLLDWRILEFSWRLDDKLKLNDAVTKSVLRNVLYRHVPRELVERKKMGFSVPLDAWLRGPLKQWAGDMLRTDGLSVCLPFKAGAVEAAWNGYLKRGAPSAYQIWSLVILAAWLRNAPATEAVRPASASLAPA